MEKGKGSMSKTIAIMATLDTKGEEVKYLKEQIERRGKKVFVIDMGLRGIPAAIPADVTRDMLAEASGSTMAVMEKMVRGEAIEIMVKGIAKVLRDSYDRGKYQGILAIGGLDGALLASAGLRALPLGVPKFLLTPIAEGEEKFGTYIGTSDMIMMHSVVDILGINQISRKVFDNAAGALVGMVDMNVVPKLEGRNVIAATMYGNTTPAVMRAKKILEEKGFELVIFHPNGTGGRAMEELIEEGLVNAVLDMTPHEIVDELFHGVHAGGPHRLEAAGKKGIPQVVVTGCLDFILLGPIANLEEKYKKRPLYFFNPAVTMVKMTLEERATVGRVMAEKLNKATGPTRVLIPLKGFCMYCHPGEPLHDPEGDRMLIKTLKEHLKPQIPVLEVDAHINDPEFADTAAAAMIELIRKTGKS
jgi:uncharacterized protein (UPF0261 family)